jgi:8-hydroxy-5-deazaflavin:NADPH oxidoreductase
MKKAGVIGSGPVAQVLANGFLKYGFEVMTGSRDPKKLEEWKSIAGKNAFTGSLEDAGKFGDIIVLAVKGEAADEAIQLAGYDNLKGKTLIDTTNPISSVPPEDGVLHFFTDLNESLMEKLQKKYPEINFVKAFNSVGNVFMVDPKFEEGMPTMFICGNNDQAKAEVKNILDLFGWETADMGKAAAARAIEPLCILWCIPGFIRNQWMHAFKLYKM